LFLEYIFIFLYPLNSQDYNDFPTSLITHSPSHSAYSNFKELTAPLTKYIIIIIMKLRNRLDNMPKPFAVGCREMKTFGSNGMESFGTVSPLECIGFQVFVF